MTDIRGNIVAVGDRVAILHKKKTIYNSYFKGWDSNKSNKDCYC